MDPEGVIVVRHAGNVHNLVQAVAFEVHIKPGHHISMGDEPWLIEPAIWDIIALSIMAFKCHKACMFPHNHGTKIVATIAAAGAEAVAAAEAAAIILGTLPGAVTWDVFRDVQPPAVVGWCVTPRKHLELELPHRTLLVMHCAESVFADLDSDGHRSTW